MHELGIVFEVVKLVEQVAVEQQLPAVDTIVLQVGQKAVFQKHETETRRRAGNGKVSRMRGSIQRYRKRRILSEVQFF